MDQSALGPDQQLVEDALGGQTEAMQRLVSELIPTVQARVGALLLRRRGQTRGRPIRQEAEDLVQEVFAALFERQGRALRSWQPERGLSLRGFVGLVAEREAGMILRTGRRNPFTEDPSDDEVLERHQLARTDVLTLGGQVESRDLLRAMRDALQERLSPQGFFFFELLFVEERGVAEVAQATGSSRDAVYAWRSRIMRLAREVYQQIQDSPASSRRDVAPSYERVAP